MTNVYYDGSEYDEDKTEKMLNSMCECGHKLYMHGFTDNYDDYSDSHFLRVSQCVTCGLEKCKQFKRASKRDK